MITFGFKSRFGGWLRALCAIAIGAVMVASPATSLVLVVKLVAAFLIASGVISIVYGIMNKDRNALGLMSVNSVVDIILGAMLFMFPGAVASIIIIILGVALLGLGIFQIVVLGSAFRMLGMGFLAFIMPVLCTVGGLLLLFNPFGSAATLTLVAGICVIVYGVSELLATLQMNRARKVYEAKMDSTVSAGDVMNAKDVDYEKIDEQ
ncbi:MAG: DUF308 domain-containing protein [Bacteroidales bacterium]|nr:DUF308 domain-containing protein [Bacteroides sp.]MCM1198545.1 DUF308 domain-containing protein [Clostridium sp.]MCM1501501.1 DUF308 domain-containing protein [Bacteroidales bacterium]